MDQLTCNAKIKGTCSIEKKKQCSYCRLVCCLKLGMDINSK